MTGALARAGRNLQVAIDQPGGKSAKVLADLMGGAQNLAQLGLKPMDERIQIVLQRIFALNDVGERNVALQALLGRGWQENVETLKAYANHLQEAIEQAKKFGTFYDDEQAAKAHEFEEQINTLKASLSGMATSIGREVIPAVNSLIQAFYNAQSSMRDSAKESENWGEDHTLAVPSSSPMKMGTAFVKGHHEALAFATQLISNRAIFRRELQAATDEPWLQTPGIRNNIGGRWRRSRRQTSLSQRPANTPLSIT